MAKLTFLWYDILVKKGSLQRNGMAVIPKIELNFELKPPSQKLFLD